MADLVQTEDSLLKLIYSNIFYPSLLPVFTGQALQTDSFYALLFSLSGGAAPRVQANRGGPSLLS